MSIAAKMIANSIFTNEAIRKGSNKRVNPVIVKEREDASHEFGFENEKHRHPSKPPDGQENFRWNPDAQLAFWPSVAGRKLGPR